MIDWPTWFRAMLSPKDWAAQEAMGHWRRGFDSVDNLVWLERWVGAELCFTQEWAHPVLASGIGLARADVFQDGTWQPADREGWPVVTYPLLGLMDGGLWCEDIIAIDAMGGTQMWVRRGAVGALFAPDPAGWPTFEYVLGSELEEIEAVRVYRSAQQWIKDGRPPGSCVVWDWDADGTWGLKCAANEGQMALVADDDEHAADLRRDLRPRRPPLQVSVVEQGEA